ncbi:TIGR03557 family F420-dependent LLM class oxidoreductase [Kineococcus rubinsiae]|uniref:TIGR03557 family F420-dependent LLM class oxidoreductase n=1 Tax=Kineococcus rubinsiae TaxID=2609562 RepID=UPI001431F9B5|nr:TIGR03557 family F420-dependent LLM class oxidoreductase [Kineococcus rubinsiae]NIZ91872.1 TIGR03557 family F420-dependent LLM class oxidoreductase [Kineococcus rubinsiae]
MGADRTDTTDTAGTGGRGPTRRGVVAGAATLGTAALTGATAASTAAASGRHEGAARTYPVGFVLSHEQFRTQDLVRWGCQAEEAGFGYLWTSDHVQPWQDDQQHSMHPWITQGLLSQATRQATFGTGVTCPTYRHHPSEVAQAWASLGILAPGRVFLGVGTGEALNEKASTGQFGPYEERAARLVEAVQLIRELWTGERTSFRGTYYTTEQFKLYDVPEVPVPIYLAASGPKSAYNAGRHGDGWIGAAKDFSDPELTDAFARGAADAGKDPDTMPKLGELFVNVDEFDLEHAATLWRFTVDSWDPGLLYEPNPVRIQEKAAAKWPLEQVHLSWPKGSPGNHITAVQQLLDAGVTPMVHSGQRDQSRVIDFYRRFVLPHLQV